MDGEDRRERAAYHRLDVGAEERENESHVHVESAKRRGTRHRRAPLIK